MPILVVECPRCNHVFERYTYHKTLESIKNKGLTKSCPKCYRTFVIIGSEVNRLVELKEVI